MITIMDIAKMANVSRTTVSRVLNNSGYVSDEARERVLKAIKETGYVPSHQAKTLRTKKSKVIGVILPRISTETSSKVVMGMDSILSVQGYQILLANTNLSYEKEIEYIQLLINRQVDGIIMLATNVRKELVEELKSIRLPFVAVGQDIPGCTSVNYDDYHAAKEITEQIIHKGRKRIAFIGVTEEDVAVGQKRKNGFLDALAEAGIQYNEKLIGIGGFTSGSGYDLMKEIVETKKEMPDGLFAATDRLAVGAMAYLKEKNIKIPEQISVAGIGASDLSKYVTPSLTTVDYENEKAGQAAAELLLEQISGGSKGPKKLILNYRLIKRDSL